MCWGGGLGDFGCVRVAMEIEGIQKFIGGECDVRVFHMANSSASLGKKQRERVQRERECVYICMCVYICICMCEASRRLMELRCGGDDVRRQKFSARRYFQNP